MKHQMRQFPGNSLEMACQHTYDCMHTEQAILGKEGVNHLESDGMLSIVRHLEWVMNIKQAQAHASGCFGFLPHHAPGVSV